MMTSKKHILRPISIFVLSAFLIMDSAIAIPPMTTTMAGITRMPINDFLFTPDQLSIPFDNVNLKEIHIGDSGRLIIHIQDAHTNLSGQKSLANALDFFMKQYDLNLVLVEGSARDSSLDEVRKLAPLTEWKVIARRLLFEGIVSGEEYLNLTTEHPMKIIGVEYQDLYDEALMAYASLMDQRKDILHYLYQAQTSLERLKHKFYTERVLEYESEKKVWERDEFNFQDQFKSLQALAKETKLNLNAYPQIIKLQSLQQVEQSLDYEKANGEQEKLLKAIADRGGNRVVSDFVKSSKRLKNRQISQYLLMRDLFAFAQKIKLDVSAYPTLVSYMEYLKSFTQLELESLLNEMEQLEDTVYDRMLESSHAKKIRAIDRFLGLLGNAYKIQMSSEDFANLKFNESDFPTESWLAFMNQKLAEVGFFESMMTYKPMLEQARENLGKFYTLVGERDYAFIDNANRIMEQRGEEAAVLIAGGYHTEHITQLLKEEGASYIVLTPVVTDKTDHDKYEQMLIDQLKYKAKELANFKTPTPFKAETVAPTKIPRGMRDLALTSTSTRQSFSDPNVNDFIEKRRSGLLNDLVRTIVDLKSNNAPSFSPAHMAKANPTESKQKRSARTASDDVAEAIRENSQERKREALLAVTTNVFNELGKNDALDWERTLESINNELVGTSLAKAILNLKLAANRADDEVTQAIEGTASSVSKDALFADDYQRVSQFFYQAILKASSDLQSNRYLRGASIELLIADKFIEEVEAFNPFANLSTNVQRVNEWLSAERESRQNSIQSASKIEDSLKDVVEWMSRMATTQDSSSPTRGRQDIEALTIEELAELVSSNRGIAERIIAAEAIGKSGSEAQAAIPALIEVLQKNEALKEALQNNTLTPMQLIEIKDNRFLNSVIWALGKIGPQAENAVPRLITILSDGRENEDIHKEAINSLGKIGAGVEEISAVIIKALDNPSPKARAEAARVLGRLRSSTHPGIPELTNVLQNDDNEWVRATAAEALGAFGTSAINSLSVLKSVAEQNQNTFLGDSAASAYKQIISSSIPTQPRMASQNTKLLPSTESFPTKVELSALTTSAKDGVRATLISYAKTLYERVKEMLPLGLANTNTYVSAGIPNISNNINEAIPTRSAIPTRVEAGTDGASAGLDYLSQPIDFSSTPRFDVTSTPTLLRNVAQTFEQAWSRLKATRTRFESIKRGLIGRRAIHEDGPVTIKYNLDAFFNKDGNSQISLDAAVKALEKRMKADRNPASGQQRIFYKFEGSLAQYYELVNDTSIPEDSVEFSVVNVNDVGNVTLGSGVFAVNITEQNAVGMLDATTNFLSLLGSVKGKNDKSLSKALENASDSVIEEFRRAALNLGIQFNRKTASYLTENTGNPEDYIQNELVHTGVTFQTVNDMLNFFTRMLAATASAA